MQLWRRPVGPGWSSFAVQDGRFYTQEQRGDDEIVACHDVATGKQVWRHVDRARFWESNAGPGPRATPTLSNGRVYTQGGTGIVNVLDAATGNVVWSHNAVTDTGTKVPAWGIAGSPLVVNDMVVVAAAGNLVAYDLASGKPRWTGPRRKNWLQFTPIIDHQRSPSDRAVALKRRDQCGTGGRQVALGACVAGRADRAAGSHGKWRCPDQRE